MLKQPDIEKCWLRVFFVNYSAVLGKHMKTEGGPLKGKKNIYISVCSVHYERDD